jgi:two-component system cell cycle response regulator
MLKEHPVEFLSFASELGDMEGIEFFVAAKEKQLVHQEPGVMISATQNKSVVRRDLRAGVTEVFCKRKFDQIEHFIERFTACVEVSVSGRVLLVEENTSSAIFFRHVLERIGLHVDLCPSAEDAIEKFKAHSYDLVITDYHLAGAKTGISVIHAVRDSLGKSAQTPILAISSFDDIARKLEILHSGATDFIGNPMVAEELELRVLNMLKMQAMTHRIEMQHTMMKDVALHDPLTSLFNRYFLNEISPGLIEDAYESGQPLSLLVMDIDNFARINESKGHKTGDRVLQLVAEALQVFCRSDDLLARTGSEEFVFILPGVGMDKALVRAELIRSEMAALMPCGIGVTVSIGISTLANNETYDELLRRADGAMYQAKLAGRNRIEKKECCGDGFVAAPQGDNRKALLSLTKSVFSLHHEAKKSG